MTIRLLVEAQKETKQAGDWYEEKRLGLGEDFLQEVEATYLKIEIESPTICPHDWRYLERARVPTHHATSFSLQSNL